MESIFKNTLVVILFSSTIFGQDDKELEEYGFIDIKTDSMDVPFFIDGFYVGNHPLKAPVPVLPGFHEVSYIPPDIQDEKILGTLHVATGRSDHLGGDLTPEKFAKAKNATHDDILFSPSKTPDITVRQARMHRDGETIVVLENYQPAAHLRDALNQPDN